MKKTSFFAAAAMVAALASCSENSSSPTQPSENKTGGIVFKMDAFVGNQDLVLGRNYTNAAGEQFSVDMFKYFISNIQLVRADGTVWTVPQDSSYFLVDEENAASQRIAISAVPEGDYTAVRWVIGVDSMRNTKDVQFRTGALDVGGAAQGMYWSWNSGYIFVKLEGSSPVLPSSAGGKFRYHIGGFGGYSSPTINNIRTVVIPFGSDRASVRSASTPEVHIIADIAKVFQGAGGTLSIAANPVVMFAPYSLNISANYASMFEVDHIH